MMDRYTVDTSCSNNWSCDCRMWRDETPSWRIRSRLLKWHWPLAGRSGSKRRSRSGILSRSSMSKFATWTTSDKAWQNSLTNSRSCRLAASPQSTLFLSMWLCLVFYWRQYETSSNSCCLLLSHSWYITDIRYYTSIVWSISLIQLVFSVLQSPRAPTPPEDGDCSCRSSSTSCDQSVLCFRCDKQNQSLKTVSVLVMVSFV